MKKRMIILLCVSLLFCSALLPVSAEFSMDALKPVMSYRPGDLNGDGQIGTDDARLCLQAAIGLVSLSDDDWQINAAASVDNAATASANMDFSTATARKILRSAIGLGDLNEANVVLKTGQSYLMKELRNAGSGSIFWLEPMVSDENLVVEISSQIDGEGNPGDPMVYSYTISSDVPGEYQITFQQRNVQIGQEAIVDSFTVNITVEAR